MAAIAPLLRVGLFAASCLQPRALVEAFANVAGSSIAEIVLIATRQDREPRPSWLWRIYQQIDGWAFSRVPRASENIDLLSMVGAAHVFPIPERDAYSPALAAWRVEVEKLGLDVAFTLGDIAPDMVVGLARYGIWQFDLGTDETLADGLEGVREVIERRDLTSASLNVHLAGNQARRFAQSWSRTTPFSISMNREKLLRRAAQLPQRALRVLYHAQDAALNNNHLDSLQLRTNESPRRPLNNSLEPVRSLVQVGWRMARRGLEKLFYLDQWFLAYRFSESAEDANASPDMGPYSCLVPPKDRFWADPFPLLRDDRYYIFFEELVFAEGKAHISVLEVDHHGQCSPPIRVLERPYHLSYPFLIESEGKLFMIPESGENGSVDLYVCERFPDRWCFEKRLLKAEYCADASFLKSEDFWWMFVNLGTDDNDVHDELHIYYADRLDGEWLPHPANPVKSDVRSARSAGQLYRQGEQLYRPAQIGVPLYGSGISINQVIELTCEKYLEKEVDRIIPVPGSEILGIHTLNRAGALSVVDGFTRRRRLGGKALRVLEPLLESARESGHESI